MKPTTFTKSRNQGFTLVEMIGVLAVVAILTAMLIPKIFETINSARINSAAAGINTVKNAVANHFAEYGGFADATGTILTPPAPTPPASTPPCSLPTASLKSASPSRLGTNFKPTSSASASLTPPRMPEPSPKPAPTMTWTASIPIQPVMPESDKNPLPTRTPRKGFLGSRNNHGSRNR